MWLIGLSLVLLSAAAFLWMVNLDDWAGVVTSLVIAGAGLALLALSGCDKKEEPRCNGGEVRRMSGGVIVGKILIPTYTCEEIDKR